MEDLNQADYNSHFITPKPPAKQIWELGFDERKNLAKDPKIRKQIEDEAQFDGTNVEGVRQKVREVCTAQGGWLIPHQNFFQLCRSCGLTNEYMAKRLISIFDKDKTGFIHGVLLTKHIHTMINDPSVDMFVNTAFDAFERKRGEDDTVETAYFTSVLKLPDPAAKSKKKKKKQQSADGEVPKQGAVTYPIQEASRKCLRDYPRANPFVVTRSDFARWWETDADLVAAFLCTIFEVAAHVYYTCELPKIPGTFLKTLEPVEEGPFSDADWWLFKEFERLGFDPLLRDPKKKKKKKK